MDNLVRFIGFRFIAVRKEECHVYLDGRIKPNHFYVLPSQLPAQTSEQQGYQDCMILEILNFIDDFKL